MFRDHTRPGRWRRCAYCYRRYDTYGRRARWHRDGACTPETSHPVLRRGARELAGLVLIGLTVLLLLLIATH